MASNGLFEDQSGDANNANDEEKGVGSGDYEMPLPSTTTAIDADEDYDDQPYPPFTLDRAKSATHHFLHEGLPTKVDHAFNQLKEKAGLEREWILLGVVMLVCVYLTFGTAAATLSALLTALYPLHLAMKAIRSPDYDTATEKRKMHWLIYFGLHALASALDGLFRKVPGYYLLKTAALLWLACPATNGTYNARKKLLIPLSRRFEKW